MPEKTKNSLKSVKSVRWVEGRRTVEERIRQKISFESGV